MDNTTPSQPPVEQQPLKKKMVKRLCSDCNRKLEVMEGEVECIVCDGKLIDIPPETKSKKKSKSGKYGGKHSRRYLTPVMPKRRSPMREEALRQHFVQMLRSTIAGPKRDAIEDEYVRRFLHAS